MPHKDPDVRRAYFRQLQRKYRAARRVAHEAERERRLSERQRFPAEELAWVAGLFEGEGTVSISRAGRHGYSRNLVSLTSTDKEIIDFLHSRWPGKIGTRQPKNSPRARQAFVWSLYGWAMMPFLLDIEPHVRTSRVREKIALGLESQRARQTGSRDPAYPAKMEQYRVRMSELNRRGRPA
jgi:LAGLIDADG-like domain